MVDARWRGRMNGLASALKTNFKFIPVEAVIVIDHGPIAFCGIPRKQIAVSAVIFFSYFESDSLK